MITPDALNQNLLTAMVLSPLAGIAVVAIFGRTSERVARVLALLSGGITFAFSVFLANGFQLANKGYQFTEQREWIPQLGVSYSVGIDGLSLSLILLTTFLTFLVLVASTSVHKRVPAYLICMLFLEVGMLGTLVALDGVTFYVFWELMLIPMYFLIGVWGGARRIYAALKFVLYTAFGSLLMLVAIVYLGYLCQTQPEIGHLSFALSDWEKLQLSAREELWLFLAFALAFTIKIPVFPFHTWLPDAHVEAPTGGSVILAGVLLKLGLYGLIRFCIPLFPHQTVAFAPVLATLGVIGIVYGALVAWVQTDMKKLVAYSSVSHLGFCVLGFSAMNLQGMQGSIIQMLNHGISTAALFFIVGVLYDRKHTRMIADYGGLAVKIPIFAVVFMIFTLSSIGLPLTNGFIGELLILLGGFAEFRTLGVIAVTGVVLGAMYMLSLYRRVMFGEIDQKKNGDLFDLTLTERMIFAPLIVLVFLVGLFPGPVLRLTEPVAQAAVERLNQTTTAADEGQSNHVLKETTL